MLALDGLWGIAALAALLVASILVWRLRRGWASWRARWRGSRAARAERRAARLLRREGFEIESTQPTTRLRVMVDDREWTVAVRADYLVRRGAERLVAEVKSGQVSASLRCAATRRQLIEYRLAYDVDGVLLVDMVAKRVHEVRFVGLDAAA